VSGAAPAPAYDEAVAFMAEGGWRIVVASRPDSTTLALRWLVAAGGRHDGAHPGLSRLTERLVYHARAPRRRDLIAALDTLGAEAASLTTREYAEFRAVAPAPEGQALLALLPALARAPVLSRPVVAREQSNLLGALAAPTPPGDALWELLLAALWGDHPLAQPPGGTAASLAALTPAHVATHYRAHYSPTHAVLAVAGACTIDEVRTAAAALPPWPAPPATAAAPTNHPPPLPPGLGGRGGSSPPPGLGGWGVRPPLPLGEGRGEGGPLLPPLHGEAPGKHQPAPTFQGPSARYRWAPGDLAHVAVAVPVPGMTHPHRSALRLLDYLLGRGGSARLYRALRLRRQLAYTCGSIYMPYADAGLFAAHAVCAPAQAHDVARVLADSLLGLATTPPTAAEIAAAQTRYAGSLHRAFETNASLTAILGVETLLAAWEPFAASAARVAAVTPAEVAAVARAYLTPNRLVQATVGPLDPAVGKA
jgi:predicted Zn-dependent peptidase